MFRCHWENDLEMGDFSARHIWLLEMYMVIDLKVLVRSFNCESRACYVGNPRESFFRVRESKILFRESFAKVGYHNHYVKGCHPLPPGVRQEKGTKNFGLVLVQFPVWWCLWTIMSFIGSSRASKGETSQQPNAMVLKHILAPAAVTT